MYKYNTSGFLKISFRVKRVPYIDHEGDCIMTISMTTYIC